MRFTPEMIAEDEKRWGARDVVTELDYCGNDMRDRKHMTNLDIRFYAYIMRRAHDMLKAQEPRLMDFVEIMAIYYADPFHVWPYNTPPYLYIQEHPHVRNSSESWAAWREIREIIEGELFGHTAQSYGETWRCWTRMPTRAQKEATPWQK